MRGEGKWGMGNGEMKLNRYPKYKPTGIAWLPELPEGWEYDWMEAAKAKRELASIAPLNDAKAFCAWWSDGGKELLAPFKLDGKISLITKENGEMVQKKMTNSFVLQVSDPIWS